MSGILFHLAFPIHDIEAAKRFYIDGLVDKFRMKIWRISSGSTVYDNVPSASDDIDAANPQAIGGGSIVIHTGKK